MPDNTVTDIIRAYDSKIVKAYCWGRFKVLRQPFLHEIGQYFPSSGHILDIGCGFGLFSLYYAQKFPRLEIHGIDINADRIQMAKLAAERLSLSNVSYEVNDARTYEIPQGLDGAYMLDIVHHIPREKVRLLLRQFHEKLHRDCRLVIKDVDTKPAYKLWFNYVLDKLIDIHGEVHYWYHDELVLLGKSLGFEISYHSMKDILPYPHVLYVCRKV